MPIGAGRGLPLLSGETMNIHQCFYVGRTLDSHLPIRPNPKYTLATTERKIHKTCVPSSIPLINCIVFACAARSISVECFRIFSSMLSNGPRNDLHREAAIDPTNDTHLSRGLQAFFNTLTHPRSAVEFCDFQTKSDNIFVKTIGQVNSSRHYGT
jgi:hypothetical protein